MKVEFIVQKSFPSEQYEHLKDFMSPTEDEFIIREMLKQLINDIPFEKLKELFLVSKELENTNYIFSAKIEL